MKLRDEIQDAIKEEIKEDIKHDVSIPLLAFTFFYSVSIFTIFMSFYYWLWRKDIKPEK